jgi:hypothetical protein
MITYFSQFMPYIVNIYYKFVHNLIMHNSNLCVKNNINEKHIIAFLSIKNKYSAQGFFYNKLDT